LDFLAGTSRHVTLPTSSFSNHWRAKISNWCFRISRGTFTSNRIGIRDLAGNTTSGNEVRPQGFTGA
jgi:hypothetical protein